MVELIWVENSVNCVLSGSIRSSMGIRYLLFHSMVKTDFLHGKTSIIDV